jgi:hypothetical protein
MKTLLTLSICAATASATALYAEDLVQAFERNQVLVTTITLESSTTLEDSETLMGGNEMELEMINTSVVIESIEVTLELE